jgi:hypothetical protein
MLPSADTDAAEMASTAALAQRVLFIFVVLPITCPDRTVDFAERKRTPESVKALWNAPTVA